MCKHGNTIQLEVVVSANYSSTGKDKLKLVDIDSCIFPLVKALNDAGIPTIASCCGHNKIHGNIALCDGRELFIIRDYATARQADETLRIKT